MTKRPVVIVLSTPFTLRCGIGRCESNDDWDTPRISRYMGALSKEIEANASQFEDCEIRAIRFGTGVATLAQGLDFERVIHAIRANYSVADNAPLSTTASISDISGASMPLFKRAGVTRFDFEMMSLDSFDFPRVNKRDSLYDYPLICDRFLHSYRTNNLGLVLAYGLPENSAPFRRSILAAARGRTCHIQLRFWNAQEKECKEESEEQLFMAREILAKYGFEEYASLCFARENLADPCIVAMENLEDEILGFGVGAMTRFDGVESVNTGDYETYMEFSYDFARITERVNQIGE